jgi:hypothetical protein
MKMITLLDRNNCPIAINSGNILTIFPNPLNDGVIIEMIDKSQIIIPHMTIEEVVAKINQNTNVDKIGQMTTAICDRISHLEDAMAAGLQYVGRSCH